MVEQEKELSSDVLRYLLEISSTSYLEVLINKAEEIFEQAKTPEAVLSSLRLRKSDYKETLEIQLEISKCQQEWESASAATRNEAWRKLIERQRVLKVIEREMQRKRELSEIRMSQALQTQLEDKEIGKFNNLEIVEREEYKDEEDIAS